MKHTQNLVFPSMAFCTFAEAEHLTSALRSVNPQAALEFELSALSGLRPTEASRLLWGNLNLRARAPSGKLAPYVHIPASASKSGVPHNAPIFERAYPLLIQLEGPPNKPICAIGRSTPIIKEVSLALNLPWDWRDGRKIFACASAAAYGVARTSAWMGKKQNRFVERCFSPFTASASLQFLRGPKAGWRFEIV